MDRCCHNRHLFSSFYLSAAADRFVSGSCHGTVSLAGVPAAQARNTRSVSWRACSASTSAYTSNSRCLSSSHSLKAMTTGYRLQRYEQKGKEPSASEQARADGAFPFCRIDCLYAYIIPPLPAPPAGIAGVSSLMFATTDSVVSKVDATLVAF